MASRCSCCGRSCASGRRTSLRRRSSEHRSFGSSRRWRPTVASRALPGAVRPDITGNNDLRETAPASRAHTVYRLLIASAALSIGGWFALLLPILTVRTAWKAWRDWPFRPYLLLLIIVGGAFSAGLLAVSNRIEFLEWQWRFIWTGAPALVVVGLFNHFLLAGSMDSAASLPKSHNANTI